MSYVDTIISGAGLAVSAIAILYSVQRASKEDIESLRDDAIKLEHRLTILENSQFSLEDRKCLQDVAIKMSLLWETIKQESPSLLKHEHTPRYDELLQKAGIDTKLLSDEEREELTKFLAEEVVKAGISEKQVDIARGFIAAIYSKIINYEHGENNGCKYTK
jgi:hypothetical protein